MFHSPQLVRRWIFAGFGLIGLSSSGGFAEEPAAQFVERLREEKLFDLASSYLEIYGKKGWLPESMKRDAPLERLMIIQDSLAASRTTKERDDRLAALENGYRDFLENAKNHPRRSEAGLRFGNLMLDRGQRDLKKLVDPSQKSNVEALRKSARDAFTQSESVFKKTQDDLASAIKEMAGAKVAAGDTEKIAQRKRYQAEYRQAQILQGLVLKLIATTYPDNAKEYADWLKKAEEKLSEVITKATSSTEVGAKTLSRLYRGDVQALQGKVGPAIESYTPVADIEEDGIFRLWRVQATAAIVRLSSAEAAKGSEGGKEKFEASMKKGLDLLKKMGKNEQMNPEWLDLQLAISEARIAYSDFLKKNKGSDTAVKGEIREARELLTVIARRPGDHQSKAKKLLSELGVNVAEPTETKLPVIRTFADGFKEAKTRLERSESSQLSIEIIQGRLKETSGAEKASVEAELKATLDAASRDRDQALLLLSQAIRLYGREDSREDLLTARFYMAYLLVKQDRYWEALAVADFVARSGPGTETGLKASAFALFGFNKVIEELPADRKMNLTGSLESLAKYMIGTWPDAEETKQATLTLLQQALQSKRWDEAERFLTLLPKKGNQASATRRDLGYVLWIQYLISIDADRKAGNEKATGDVELRERAERMLSEGWKALELESLDQRAVEAAGALAALYLRTERREEAEAILDREKIGPVAVISAPTGPVKDAKVRLEILRLKLQAKVMAAGSGASSLDPKEVQDLVKAMQDAAGKDPKLLGSTLFILAKDLQEQLTRVDKPADKAKLAGGFHILLTQLADVSTDAGMLDWAGTTMWQLGAGLREQAGAGDVAKKLSGGASQIFQKMLDAYDKDPKFLDSIQRKPEDILIKQALAYRDQTEHQKAADLFLKILKANPNQLTAQLGAARNYQEWAAGNNVDLLKKAIFGTEPGAGGKNTVWGWGTIAQKLSSQMANQKNFQDTFFEARLELATCRRLIGKTMAAADQKKPLEQAVNDVRQTFLTYPELGGKESKDKFDKLLRTLQGELGKPAIGLKEFAPNPVPNANQNPNPKK